MLFLYISYGVIINGNIINSMFIIITTIITTINITIMIIHVHTFFFHFFCTYVYDDISKQIFRLPSTQNFTAGTGRLPGLLLPGERWGNSDSPQ